MHRLEHYWDTLELFVGRRPELPFLSGARGGAAGAEAAPDDESG